MSDWKPSLYLKFEKERTQPAIDLVNRIEIKSPKRIIDIGCGPGNSTKVLQEKWEKAEIIGIDSSSAMIEKAKENYAGIDFIQYDASSDLSFLGKFDIIFSNAAFQWIPDNHLLIPKLFDILNNNGVLAVQVPCTVNMPISIELKKLVKTDRWKKYFDRIKKTHSIHDAVYYYSILCGITDEINLWQTDYIHIMNSHNDLVEWYKSTGLRPYLDCLTTDDLKKEFALDFENKLKEAYPLQEDNKVLFPFTRIFFTAGLYE